MKYLLLTPRKMVYDPQVENHWTKPTIQYNWISVNDTAQFLYLKLCQYVTQKLKQIFTLADSVWAVSVTGLFDLGCFVLETFWSD